MHKLLLTFEMLNSDRQRQNMDHTQSKHSHNKKEQNRVNGGYRVSSRKGKTVNQSESCEVQSPDRVRSDVNGVG